jgi:hypothetical protein
VARRILTMADRAQIGVGIKSGLSDREIGELMDRHHTVTWRERGRNSTRTRGIGRCMLIARRRSIGHGPRPQGSGHGVIFPAWSGAGFDLVAQEQVGAGVAGLGGGEVFTQLRDRGGGARGG